MTQVKKKIWSWTQCIRIRLNNNWKCRVYIFKLNNIVQILLYNIFNKSMNNNLMNRYWTINIPVGNKLIKVSQH